MSDVREKRPGICGVCPGGCAVELELEEGKLTGIKPLKGVPFGSMCLRGKHAPEVLYSPDRLKTPLIREGKKGEGRFREASWDEALELVVENIRKISEKYGPQAVASHTGRGTFEQSMIDFNRGESAGSSLLAPLGSPNAGSVSSLCYISYGVIAPMTTYGVLGSRLAPDIENSNLIVVWGANPATDSPLFMFERILKAKQKGTRIIAIDSMQSDIAKRADQWIPIRSGTDGALALALIQVVIAEKLYDEEFVSKWTHGFSELAEYVQQYTPDKVEKITGIPEETIISLAREIALAKHATLRNYTGLEYSNSGVQNLRAVNILWAITGNIDVKGGIYINPPAKETFKKANIAPPKGTENILPIGAEEYPLFYKFTGQAQFMEFPKAVLEEKPYPVKALLNIGASIITSYPQSEVWEEALSKLEFLAVIDRFMTKDALYADVILPAATYFEIDSYQRYPGYVRLRKKIVEPIGEARPDLFILADIAKGLGYGELFPKDSDELLERAFSLKPELLEKLKVTPEGVALDTPPRQYKKYESGLLRSDGKPGFETPSGKLEIKSSLLEECGYAGLPEYTEPAEGPMGDPELYKNYPLILSTGARIQSTFRSQHLNIPGLLKYQPNPEALMHPEEANSRGIKDGDKVVVSTRRGEVEYYAKVCEAVPIGVVEINVGGGTPVQAESWKKANGNKITDMNNRDPISGFPVLKALLCQVRKAE